MEAPTPVNKKAIKRTFKEIYPKFDPEKTKVVSQEDAINILVECMTKNGLTYSPEEAKKILIKFDVDKNGKNAKNEVKRSLMIAARIEELNEKMIMKMKKKWEKKQNKKKKASLQEKKKAKQLKKKFKGSFKVLMNNRPCVKNELISFNEAEGFATTLLTNMEVEVNKDKMMDLFAKMDSTNAQGLHIKELKLICKELVGLREVDLERAHNQRTKWLLKKEKKEMKRKKKEEKMKAKEQQKNTKS